MKLFILAPGTTLVFISPEAAGSSWVKKEIGLALEKEQQQSFKMRLLMPIRMPNVSDEAYNKLFPRALERKYIPLDGYESINITACAKKIEDDIVKWKDDYIDKAKITNNREQDISGNLVSCIEKLWIRISDRAESDLWEELEDMAVKSVIAGGISAMSYYRECKRSAVVISKGKNPACSADLQATISILRVFDSLIATNVQKLGCDLYYLGEETVYKDEILVNIKKLEGEIVDKEQFFEKKSNCIKVIIDAIDGTSNFVRGIPFFCSSLAIFVDDQLRISAIYDPLHHHVYSGLLPGPYVNPERKPKANLWDVASGTNENLRDRFEKFSHDNSAEKSLAIHIPRNDPVKREEFICPQDSGKILLKELANKVASIYALNSGLLALAQVAGGALDGFVNITTNAWDVAAGEVLLKACGGYLTDFDGNKLKYDSPDKISVVAANSKEFHASLIDLIKDVRQTKVEQSND
ncbi:MAG: hypothetical protein NTX45_21970 [Proteobacteria bacterium]|nr:hypothetical protein [Pseudomonadota bacterium]